jgi:hypothetical protein
MDHIIHSYGHLLVITGYFNGIIHSINGVLLVLVNGISGHNCNILANGILYGFLPHFSTQNPQDQLP